jgi:drug/metabolite transporter (DMT)-like permease
MLPVLIGITSALIYGAADFLGGLGAARISPLRVTAVSAASGLLILLLATPFITGTISTEAVALGALSGVTGAIAISLLYACLAIGPMSILSPLTAVVSAIVPVTVGLAQGERLRPIGYVAIVLALVAVVLVGFVREKNAVRPSPAALLMAVASGAMIGVFLVIIDLTPDDSGLIPLVANRVVTAVLMLLAVALVGGWMRRQRRPGETSTASRSLFASIGLTKPGWRAGAGFAIACGFVDSLANAGLLLGLRLGELSVISVLTALYPAGTIVLAAVVLKERIAVVQYVGLALAIGAAALLALA